MMKWSWRIGRSTGIDIYIHASFVILLGWVGATCCPRAHSFVTAMLALAFTTRSSRLLATSSAHAVRVELD